MADLIRVRRGNKANLPTLNDGEFGLSEDTKELFIGSTSGNLKIPRSTQEAWIAPTLQNGWENYNTANSPAGYFKDELGIVHLRGLIKLGTTVDGTVLFVLPVGYRPAYIQNIPVISTNGTAWKSSYVNISATNGDVATWGGAYNSWLSLDGITFRAEL